jgi:hypothetical protein
VRPRAEHVELAIADHDGPPRERQPLQRPRDRLRLRLVARLDRRPVHRREVPAQAERLQELLGEPRRLGRRDDQRDHVAQGHQHLPHAVERRRLADDRLRVPRAVAQDQRVGLRVVGRAQRQERPPRRRADHRPDVLLAALGQPVLGQRPVDRPGERAARVDQDAVQVEEHRVGMHRRHHHLALTV